MQWKIKQLEWKYQGSLRNGLFKYWDPDESFRSLEKSRFFSLVSAEAFTYCEVQLTKAG